jgi:uncharacterized iron-regulated protein
MRHHLLLAACIATAAPASAQNALAGTIVDVAAGETLPSMTTLIERLQDADVVILGEIHDNPAHHAGQAEIVAGIGPDALTFEMVPPSAEAMIARLRGEGAPAAVLGAALEWEARGWPDFAMYAPIFEAAPKAEVTGGAVSGEAMRLAMEAGALAGAEAALGYAARRYDLDAAYAPAVQAEAVAEHISAHCDAIPETVAARMVEAQRLRDAAFADGVLRARALADGGQVVLITGGGHARTDRGVPRFLEAADPSLTVVAVTYREARAAEDDWRAHVDRSRPRYDYVVFTEAVDREDPCIAFRRSRQ